MNIWRELRRRQMFRLVGIYIVGAWLVIQVADIAFPAWGIPDTALKYLFYAAFLCFPIAFILGWFFDIRKEGIYRTRRAGPDEIVETSLQKADYVVLTALLAVGLAVVLGSLDFIRDEVDLSPASITVERRDNSIAVLPFTNLDLNPETGFFSDGITEEILHRLSTLGALHVLASTSSFAFRNSEKGPASISEKLGVRYLLQGSIRRDSDYVRVTARLIDDAGFQVWSQTFDRKLQGIFAIQTEIASTVSSEIINEIVPLQELPAGRTTTNMEAYNEYLVGKAFADGRAFGWREKAEAAYRRAIELDPDFAPPYAGLALALTVNKGFGPHFDEGRKLAEHALQLDPELAEAHAMLGFTVGVGSDIVKGDLQRGTTSLRRALELDPSLGFAYNLLAAFLEWQGLIDESNAVMDKGLAVDPLNPPLVANAATAEFRKGNRERAEHLVLRLLNLPESPRLVFPTLQLLYEKWGRLADAVEIAKEHIRISARAERPNFRPLALAYANLGMTEDADYWKDLSIQGVDNELEVLDFNYALLRKRSADSMLGDELRQLDQRIEPDDIADQTDASTFLGLTNIQLGNYEKGIEQLEAAIRSFMQRSGHEESAILVGVLAEEFWGPKFAVFVLHRLAHAYRQVDRADDAATILLALTDDPTTSPELADEFLLEYAALHHALSGNTPEALHIFEKELETGWGVYFEILNEPAWKETINAPEFQEFLAEMKEEVDRQRTIVEAADAEHDFRAEVEQLLAD
jgi:TolB-like protein/Flp pilus assembly protein TadD